MIDSLKTIKMISRALIPSQIVINAKIEFHSISASNPIISDRILRIRIDLQRLTIFFCFVLW